MDPAPAQTLTAEELLPQRVMLEESSCMRPSLLGLSSHHGEQQNENWIFKAI
jgi:hypothetical protein